MSGKRYAGTLPEGGAVEFEVVNGRIGKVTPTKDSANLPWLMPVLVDVQQNGAVGFSYSTLKDPDPMSSNCNIRKAQNDILSNHRI